MSSTLLRSAVSNKKLHRRITAPIVFFTIAGLALAGCSSSGGGTSSDKGPGDAGKADGVVTIYGTIVDTEAELLQKSWADWEKKNKITIKYEGSKEFETQISVRAQGGNAPDIAIFPQPGLLKDLASRDFIQPEPADAAANVKKNWSKDWAAYASSDGTLYASPLMASVKGFVWYSPAKFAEWGVEVPKTWDELLTLTKTIQEKTGTAPWCAGFGSDAAFNSVGDILLNPKYVNAGLGDVKSINSTPFGDVARVVGNGSCAMTHQASFFDGFIQDPKNGNATVGPDKQIWAFITPPIDASAGPAVTGGGEMVAAFSNDADTQKVQAYLSSGDWANSRVKLGGVISANKGLDPANASSPILQEAIKTLQDPKTTFRFDASDLMPGVVGTGSFWTGMVDWINGKSTDEVLKTIDASWPSK